MYTASKLTEYKACVMVWLTITRLAGSSQESYNRSIRKTQLKTHNIKWLVPIVCLAVLILWLAETPAGLLGKADAVGYAVCHRISVRSFFLDDRPLPLCARCTGMYLGAMAGLLYQFFGYPRRGGMLTWKTGLPFAIFALCLVV